MEMADAYRRWARSHRSLGVSLDVLEERHHVHTENDALDAAEIDELVDGTVRTMFELQQEGMTLLEIAEVLSASGGKVWTEGAVRSAMTRVRTKAREARHR